MLTNFEDFQKLGKEGVEATVQSFTAASKGAQRPEGESALSCEKPIWV